ncbi:DNA polymerase/3'-5' exonuclease PolX [Sediminibacterium ginsengisoli]|uniref:DNA polymerase (Family 10) n=1 Tax=Sediminibacterium ginsengisoli TaxID=413434 RepID=A0A1T4RTK7_9BACT|nr:DNA polymerase/3'-5' exonuclease PolX [Sediminibacterium ginsengisoli]SKA18931.1 DNA polymerase (family 10) [Sediminibacterium ginsengisoli]
MDNYSIADHFSLLSKLMDIHGDNSFKAKSYAAAAFTIEKLPVELSTLPHEKIFSIKGIGDAIGKKIIEQLETGQLSALTEYLEKTPQGIIEMMNIKGIGPKKIATIWKELEIETLGELLYACNENRLTLYRGFGEKTQLNIRNAIEFYFSTLGSYLYQQIESYATVLDQKLKEVFRGQQFFLTGEYRRQLEIINRLEWVTTVPAGAIKDFFTEQEYEITASDGNFISLKGRENVSLSFYSCTPEAIHRQLFLTSCSEEFLQAWKKLHDIEAVADYPDEEKIFEAAGITFIPAYRREKAAILEQARNGVLPEVITPQDITGIIHCHSKWSDGASALDDMAQAAIDQGYQYLVISDHSKSAFYAGGLNEEKVMAQHKQIEELNSRLAPFRIFKSIESDILNDGSLDYSNEVLASFDLVIASVHSNLKMSEEKAMMRLIKAIENPYTSILGHMTGRLLLSRNGYPVDHRKIIDACAANQVVIELNAHPRRLDIDWRWIDLATEKGVLISIDPDAHAIDGFNDCRYGVFVAQKAGLRREQNLSSFSLAEFESFVQLQQRKR